MSDGSQMTDNEKAGHLVVLLEHQLDHFKQTREIEFKVNLAFWTAIAVTGAFLYREGLRLSSCCDTIVYSLVAFLVWFAHVILWMVPIQYSEDTDDHFINQYRWQVESLCGFSPKQRDPGWFWSGYKQIRTGGVSWVLAETWVTLFLLIALGFVLGTWWR